VIELVAIPYSPWSEKARWALDHHGVRYEEQEYLPMLGEPALRKRLGQWRGKISVPVLITANRVIRDSFQIAEYSEEIGSNPVALFPAEGAAAIAGWNEQSETALQAGRAMVSQRVLDDPEAKREAMPSMPKALTSVLMTPVTALGVAYLQRKYKYSAGLEDHRTALRQVLSNLRDSLADGRPFVLGQNFSYADICMASALQSVRPVTDEFLKLGPATRRSWTDEELAEEFASLLDWRDQIYETHRLT
jgi:glutathione S-transferase